MKSKFASILTLSFLLLAIIHPAKAQLSSGGTPAGFKQAPSNRLHVIDLPAINVDSMLAEDAINEHYKNSPYRFGYNHLVNYTPQNSGTWTTLFNGDRIWQLDVRTRGSYSINLAFDNFKLTGGAKLFVYSKDHQQILGGFTAANNSPDNMFGTELINGDEAVIEFYEPAADAGRSSFNLFRITQGYKDMRKDLKSFGQAGSCIHNINCPQYADVATQKRAVICLVSGGNEICSGSLVNNTSNDGTPYILTANHCGPADGAWVFRFNWEAPGCANPATNPSTAQSITGCTLVAQNSVSDFLLVKMDTTPPPSFHAFYAGWNHSPVPATSVTCIHHPQGDIKKCSRANNAVTDSFYDAGNGVALCWLIGQWTDGATQPGSSGSPLFDQNKRIVGQLYGGPSDCGAAPSDLRDFYGRFPVSWDSGSTPATRLKEWLDPGNTGDTTNDGYYPYPLNDTLNVALLHVISPTGSSCQNTATPVISVENVGSTAIHSLTITYHVNSGADTSYSWTGTLQALDSVVISLPVITGSTGQDTFNVTVTSPNGTAIQNPVNNVASATFIVFPPNGVSAPLVQGFEGGTFPPAGWNITTPGSGVTWAAAAPGSFGTSSTSAEVGEFSPTSSTAGETPSLISPAVDMSHVHGPTYLQFDVAYSISIASYNDSLAVFVSTNCGLTWNKIYQKGGASLATAPLANQPFSPTATQWRTDTVNISNLIGNGAVIFKFEVISGWGNNVYLDNINIADTLVPTAVNDLNDAMNLQVFPNPFGNNINLHLTLNTAQNVTAILYSADGKELIKVLNNSMQNSGEHRFEINTQTLSNGLYILKVNGQYFKVEKLR